MHGYIQLLLQVLEFYQKELLPVESFEEFCDVAGELIALITKYRIPFYSLDDIFMNFINKYYYGDIHENIIMNFP